MAYLYSDEELENYEIEDILIIMDSNVWLDLYTYPPASIENIIECFNENMGSFWLPYQVYIEFNRHVTKSRDEALYRYQNIKAEVCRLISDSSNKINAEFNKHKNKGFADAIELQKHLQDELSETIKKSKSELDSLYDSYKEEIACVEKENDIIAGLIENLNQQRGDSGFLIMELLGIYEEGERRYKYKMSPGFSDEKKKDNVESEQQFLLRKYGDLIIWKEIIRKTQNQKVTLIFVENERKSDWWDLSGIKKIPQVLKEEFSNGTSEGSKLIMIDFDEFLHHFGGKFNMLAGSVSEITNRAKFSKQVHAYIQNSKHNIVEIMVNEYMENNGYGNELTDCLTEISIFGGSVDSIDDVEITRIQVRACELIQDNDWDTLTIAAVVEIEFDASISEYVQRDVSHSGSVHATMQFSLNLDLLVDITDTNISERDACKITINYFEDIEILAIDHDEFSIDVSFDEDMFRDR
ncbi:MULTISPECIES: PIN-like domain-containing protein [unclassified Dehalobacter]|uniref:PIN-like domain-containing protein n=1 Tax=unclassified Dehalobacter TaxID=2635733 RepID=UPI000387780C|nr:MULTISPECIES: PIN-like domain-containing protein [unclassified Dehalobacter]EQB22720.1 hypothetical protein UNSWDHB_2956 [Dehalobacter sp. UNSWDHB]MDJ0304841.1 PIN-like domain-containing protein [Dehalobacter sp.]